MRIYNILLDGMDHDDPAIRLECLRALRQITGKDARGRHGRMAARARTDTQGLAAKSDEHRHRHDAQIRR